MQVTRICDNDPQSPNTETIQIYSHTLLNLASINCVLDMKRGILKDSFMSRLFVLLIKKCANPLRS